ncbi:hypothetical protein EJB05_08635, partial [Eragrostis curvula]
MHHHQAQRLLLRPTAARADSHRRIAVPTDYQSCRAAHPVHSVVHPLLEQTLTPAPEFFQSLDDLCSSSCDDRVKES